MNGEMALLWLKMMRAPTKTSMMMMGVSHQAFRTFRKSHNSPINERLFDMVYPIMSYGMTVCMSAGFSLFCISNMSLSLSH